VHRVLGSVTPRTPEKCDVFQRAAPALLNRQKQYDRPAGAGGFEPPIAEPSDRARVALMRVAEESRQIEAARDIEIRCWRARGVDIEARKTTEDNDRCF